MENKVIAASIQNREAFIKVLSTEIDDDFSDLVQVVWDEIKEYYNNDPNASNVDKEILIKRISRKNKKHSELFTNYISSLEEVSEVNVLKEVIDVKLEAVRHKLAQELVSGNDKYIDNLLDNYNKLRMGQLDTEEEHTEIYNNTSIGDILESTNSNNRIAILPASLNQQINGGVVRQNHVVIFAPTDMGKSLFALNMAYGFLKQGLTVLYVGNEDPAVAMIYRLMWRITGMTDVNIQKEKEKAQTLLDERNFENFIFAEMAPGSPREIEELVKEHEPDVLIVDQIRNLDMGEDHKVLSLEKAASFMRKMGKAYNLVPVSLTQAADSATGKMFLQRGDIDFSNVGIPGTADLLIGIGATDEMEGRGERMLSFVKNKISGNKAPLKVWFDNLTTKVQ